LTAVNLIKAIQKIILWKIDSWGCDQSNI